jgi:zinc protease
VSARRRFARTSAAALALAFAAVAALVLASPRAAWAKDEPAAPAFHVPKPLERELKNKLKVFVVEDHRLPRVLMRVEVRSGSADEPAEQAGLANLMLLTLRQGTEKRDAQTLAKELDGMGGTISTAIGRDQMVLTGQFLSRDWTKGLAIMSELVLTPAFKKEELERQRSQVLAARQASRDQNALVAGEHAAALVYGSHPYGRPENGEAGSISHLTREDVTGFHLKTFRPNNTLIVVVGDVNAGEAQAQIESEFKDWARADVPARPSGPIASFDSTRVRLLDKPGVSQTEIVVGLPGTKRASPDYFAAQLMNYVLGGGGFSSRLVQSARVKGGLTYGATTEFDMGQDVGAFYLTTSTKNASVGAMLDVARATLRDFRAQGPTAKELADAKRFVIGSLPLAMQSAGAIAGQWSVVERYGLGMDYFDRFAQNVEAVTAADVKAAADKYLRDDRLAIVAVGTADSIRAQLTPLGAVEVLDYRSPTGTVPQSAPRPTMPSEALSSDAQAKGKVIVDRALEAHGGAAKLKAVSTFATRADIKFTTPNGTLDGEMAMTVRLPDRSRIEMGLLGQRGVQVLNQNSGWASNGGEVTDLNEEQLAALRAGLQVQVLTLLSHLAQGRATAGWLREERIAGETVDVVQIDDAGNLARASFSKKTGLLVRLEQDEPGMFGGGMIPMARLYTDFRPVNGIVVPFKTERLARDVRLLQDAITSYEINRPVPESQFARPPR